jgi:TP901 family phage tail tape measure protein
VAVEEVGVKLLAENSDRFERQIKDANRTYLNFLDSLESGARGIDGSMDKGEKAIESFASSSESSFKRVDAATEMVIGAFRRVGEIAVNALMEAGRATGDFLADSVSTAGDFESTLNRFAAVTGDSLTQAGMDVNEFSDLFLQMGMETQYSAQEAAEAAVNLAKGGIQPAAIAAGGLEAALSLAAAGELDLAASAEILAKQLGVWSDKGVTAAQITDLLAQAANASTVDVDELANGLANVQGRAAGMGVEYEDLVQTMAMISPAFESASTAGTSLNNFLARLIPQTDKAEEAMIDLGLATSDGQSVFFDAQGSFIGMEAAIGLLSTATKDLSEEEKSAAFSIIFGNDAMGAAIALSEKGVAAYNATGEAMAAAGGAADQAAARNQGYNFALDEMRGSMETLQIVIGSALLPTLTELVQGTITPGINKFLEFSKAILESEDPMTALVAKVDEAIPGFASFLGTLANIPTRVIEISTAFQDEFAPEILLAQQVFETAMIVIEDIATAVMDTVMGAINEFTSDFGTSSDTWNDLMASFSALWTALEPIIMGVLATIGALLLVFLGVATGVFTGIINAIDPFLAAWANVLAFITVVLQGVQEVVMGFVDLVIALFQGNSEGVLQALHRMDTGARAIIIGMIGAIVTGFLGLVDTGMALIEGFVLGIVEFFARLYHELVGGSIVPDLVNDILGWFNDLVVKGLVFFFDLVEGIKGFFFDTDWAAVGSSIINGIIGGITSLSGQLATAAQTAASDAYNAVTGFLGMSSPSRLFMDVGLATMEGFAIGVDDSANLPTLAIEDAMATLALDIPSMMAGPVSGLAPAPIVNNTYSTTNVYEGENYNMNVRTPETAGTVGNTIRALQSISKIRGRG